MVTFKDALREIDTTRNRVIFITTFLKSVIFFFSMYMLLLLVNVTPYGALIFTAAYFATKLKKELNKKQWIDVEKDHPMLSERLRTAADTLTMDNIIVRKLRASVIKTLTTIPVSSFLDVKYIAKRLCAISMLAILTVYLASTGFYLIDLHGFIKELFSDFNLKDKLLKYQVPSSLSGKVTVADVNENQALQEINNQLRLREDLQNLTLDQYKGTDKTFEEMLSKKKRVYIRTYFSKIRSLT